MHDPDTVAFELHYPWRHCKNPTTKFDRTYREVWLTIWHHDPQTDGTDDSCGWFIRARHGDKAVLEKIVREFRFEWSKQYDDKREYGWFDSRTGQLLRSRHATGLQMFYTVLWTMFKHNRKRMDAYLRKHLHDILVFSDNATDCLFSSWDYPIDMKEKEDHIRRMAGCVYSYILRDTRPWYKHPKWHIWHWQVRFHPTQKLKRWLFSRCATCGKHFKWGECPTSSVYDAPGPRWFRGEPSLHHGACYGSNVSSEKHAAATSIG